MDNAKTVVLAQFDDQIGQIVVGDSAAQLAVERVDRCLAQRMAVDIVDCPTQRIGDKAGQLRFRHNV